MDEAEENEEEAFELTDAQQKLEKLECLAKKCWLLYQRTLAESQLEPQISEWTRCKTQKN